jgi:FkbM family methyltransferase
MTVNPDPLLEPWLVPYDPVATVDDIRQCFRLILGRSPRRQEWVGQSSHAGRPLDLVVANYLNTAEFARRGLLNRPPPAVECADCGDYRIYAAPLDEAVGRHALANAYEPHVTAVVRRALRPSAGMIDIGANIGVFALLAAACVGPAGYVLAMEPNPANARLLEASRRENGFSWLTVCQAAAGRAIGLLQLHTADSNGTAAAPTVAALLQGAVTVPCLRLDDLVPPQQSIALIKIDVEGAEYLALQGCERTIRRCQPMIVSEFSPDLLTEISGIEASGYLEWLFGLGYRIGVIGRDGSVSPPGTDAGAVMARYAASGVDHIDIACLPAGAG